MDGERSIWRLTCRGWRVLEYWMLLAVHSHTAQAKCNPQIRDQDYVDKQSNGCDIIVVAIANILSTIQPYRGEYSGH